MPETKKYDKGAKFMIKPISIEPKRNRPSFTMGGTTKYNFMILAETKGNTEPIIFEYACPTQNPEAFFEMNVFQWVVCMQPSDIACNIQPCEPPDEQNKSKIQMARELVDGPLKKNETSYATGSSGSQVNPIRYGEGSKEWGFVYAWAKDVVCREIDNGHTFATHPTIPDDPIKRIAYYARQLHGEMMKDVSGA